MAGDDRPAPFDDDLDDPALGGTRGVVRGSGTDAIVLPIAEVTPGERVRIAGFVRSLRHRPWARDAELELVVADRTGRVSVRYEQARPLVEAGDRVDIVGFLYEGRVYPTPLEPRHHHHRCRSRLTPARRRFGLETARGPAVRSPDRDG